MDGAEWLRWAQGDIIPEQPSDYRPTLKKGDRGEAVRAWQMLLKEKGYDIGKAGCDGIFGNDTEKAVIKYQQDHGMEAGYIGSQTWATLL